MKTKFQVTIVVVISAIMIYANNRRGEDQNNYSEKDNNFRLAKLMDEGELSSSLLAMNAGEFQEPAKQFADYQLESKSTNNDHNSLNSSNKGLEPAINEGGKVNSEEKKTNSIFQYKQTEYRSNIDEATSRPERELKSQDVQEERISELSENFSLSNNLNDFKQDDNGFSSNYGLNESDQTTGLISDEFLESNSPSSLNDYKSNSIYTAEKSFIVQNINNPLLSSTIDRYQDKKIINILPEPVSMVVQDQFPQNDAFSFEASYVCDNAYNFSGGIATGFAHLGMIDLAATISTSGAGLWDGGQLYLQIETTYGATPSADLSGDLQVFSNIENGNYTYLYQMLYSHRVSDFNLTVGLHDLNSEFFASDFAGEYINSSFGIMPSASMNVPVSIFPKTALGGIINYSPTDNLMVKAAIYDGEPMDLDQEPYNTSFMPNEEKSLFSVAEIALGFGKTENYRSTLKLGGYFHNGSFDNINNNSIAIKGNYGAYAIYDQMFNGLRDYQKIGTFAKIGLTKQDRNEFPVFWGMGINYYSPFPQRNNDLFGIAIANMGINGSLIGAELDYQHSNETVIECLYRVTINDNIVIQPEIQYIINPGAQANNGNALVGLVRAGISF